METAASSPTPSTSTCEATSSVSPTSSSSSSSSINGTGNSYSGSEDSRTSRRYSMMNVTASDLIHSPLTTLLECSGLLSSPTSLRQQDPVGIRILGTSLDHQPRPHTTTTTTSSAAASYYQRYDLQRIARLIEQVIPFSLLLLLVFIRQHLQGFCVALWVAAVLFKSNDVIRQQTALKADRNKLVIVGMSVLLVLHVIAIYWWYKDEELLYPLALLSPKSIPPFWHALFIIFVNDAMVRQVSMVFKCILLMWSNSYRKQGQLLTLTEYFVLLYRSLLPAPVWYRFFLNREYGSLFSSLVTGLYLTFKLASVLGKAQLVFEASKAISSREMHYGSHATLEQVNAAGDLCAICQEKMEQPVLLRCKHIFCEDCLLEWFDREGTCPLCRALVKPADRRSFGDGSTSLLFQLF